MWWDSDRLFLATWFLLVLHLQLFLMITFCKMLVLISSDLYLKRQLQCIYGCLRSLWLHCSIVADIVASFMTTNSDCANSFPSSRLLSSLCAVFLTVTCFRQTLPLHRTLTHTTNTTCNSWCAMLSLCFCSKNTHACACVCLCVNSHRTVLQN